MSFKVGDKVSFNTKQLTENGHTLEWIEIVSTKTGVVEGIVEGNHFSINVNFDSPFDWEYMGSVTHYYGCAFKPSHLLHHPPINILIKRSKK